jgi:hypothetical protein
MVKGNSYSVIFIVKIVKAPDCVSCNIKAFKKLKNNLISILYDALF